jgi:hypothetical protein
VLAGLSSDADISVGNMGGGVVDPEDRHGETARRQHALNAAAIFMSSCRIAQTQPQLPMAQVLLQYHSDVPTRAMLTHLNQHARLPRFFQSLSAVCLPVVLQDILANTLAHAIAGFLALAFLAIWRVDPLLVLVPPAGASFLLHFWLVSLRAGVKIRVLRQVHVSVGVDGSNSFNASEGGGSPLSSQLPVVIDFHEGVEATRKAGHRTQQHPSPRRRAEDRWTQLELRDNLAEGEKAEEVELSSDVSDVDSRGGGQSDSHGDQDSYSDSDGGSDVRRRNARRSRSHSRSRSRSTNRDRSTKRDHDKQRPSASPSKPSSKRPSKPGSKRVSPNTSQLPTRPESSDSESESELAHSVRSRDAPQSLVPQPIIHRVISARRVLRALQGTQGRDRSRSRNRNRNRDERRRRSRRQESESESESDGSDGEEDSRLPMVVPQLQRKH